MAAGGGFGTLCHSQHRQLRQRVGGGKTGGQRRGAQQLRFAFLRNEQVSRRRQERFDVFTVFTVAPRQMQRAHGECAGFFRCAECIVRAFASGKIVQGNAFIHEDARADGAGSD